MLNETEELLKILKEKGNNDENKERGVLLASASNELLQKTSWVLNETQSGKFQNDYNYSGNNSNLAKIIRGIKSDIEYDTWIIVIGYPPDDLLEGIKKQLVSGELGKRPSRIIIIHSSDPNSVRCANQLRASLPSKYSKIAELMEYCHLNECQIQGSVAVIFTESPKNKSLNIIKGIQGKGTNGDVYAIVPYAPPSMPKDTGSMISAIPSIFYIGNITEFQCAKGGKNSK